jgi:hypothetical protein
MALYVPAGARRRRLVLIAVAGLLVGAVAGFVAGRSTAPGLEDEVGEVQDLAVDAATAFQRIPIEYEQLLAGEGGESLDTVQDAVDRADEQLRAATSEAIWLSDGASDELDASIDDLRAVVAAEGSADDFAVAVDAIVGEIEATFGVDVEGAG